MRFDFSNQCGIYFEPTSVCNLKCPGCSKTNFHKGRNKHAEIETAKIVCDQIRPHFKVLYLWGFGESLLHPQIVEILDIFKDFKIYISTNGNYPIQNEKIIKRDSGLVHIRFALDGSTQNVYSKYRVGGNFHQALFNLIDCAKLRDQLQLDIEIIWQMIPFAWVSEDEIKRAHDLCNRYNIHFKLQASSSSGMKKGFSLKEPDVAKKVVKI